MEGKKIRKGILHLFPTPIGKNPPFQVIPISVKKEISSLTNFIVESERNDSRFIKKIIPKKNQDELNILILNKSIIVPRKVPSLSEFHVLIRNRQIL